MKISKIESGKAMGSSEAEAKILPKDRPRGLIAGKAAASKKLSPLEHGMLVAEQTMENIPDVREDLIQSLKERIQNGEYKVDGKEIAEMMMRRLAADRIR